MAIHTVQPGETVFSIASLYKISVEDLLLYNGLTAEDKLAVGQNLLILLPEETYTLPADTNLSALAAEVGQSERALLRNNPDLISDGELYAGRTLVLSFATPKEGELETVGYAYPFVSPEVLESALPYLSEFTVFTYGFNEEGGLIPPETDDRQAVALAQERGTTPILLLSTLGADGRFNNRLSGALFRNPQAQERLIEELLATLREKGYGGLDIDFEYVAPEDREAYADFVRRVTERLNEEGYSVTVALAPKTYAGQPGLLYEAHDYQALGKAANGVLLMTYEWGYTYGPPMAVAPLNRVREVVDYALSAIPREKILLGIPNYGYDWTLPYQMGTAARSLSPGEATKLAAEKNAEILFDEEAQAPYFYYTDGEGREHVVWFEDPRSLNAKLDLIAEKGLGGYAVWTVMRPAPALFAQTNARFEIAD